MRGSTRTLKEKFIRLPNFTTELLLFNQRLTECLIEYDFNRPHQPLGYVSPVEYLNELLKSVTFVCQMSKCDELDIYQGGRYAKAGDIFHETTESATKLDCAIFHVTAKSSRVGEKIAAVGVECKDCHMPRAVKSAVKLDAYTADVRFLPYSPQP